MLLRKRLRAEYGALNADEIKRIDEKLMQLLIEQSAYQRCRAVFIYVSVGFEINTRKIIDHAFGGGKIVALPKCRAHGEMDFYRYSGELTEGKFSIPEPTNDELLIPEKNDIMIVPGLAFDRYGYRIGQGGGYYDRYLEKHECTCIGLCREKFLLNRIPIAWNDLPVDCVITENAVYSCKNGAS